MGKTQDNGLIGHTMILNRLVQLGYEVLLPWADYLGYDLAYLVSKEEMHFGFFKFKTLEVVRIQCKVAWLSKDRSYIAFNTSTLTNRLTKHVGYHGKAEWFGVYSPDTGKVYMVAVTEARKGSEMKLRLQPTRNNQEKYVNWAKDYEF
jgi:PD-(D/E)XK nuclease superfamily protein